MNTNTERFGDCSATEGAVLRSSVGDDSGKPPTSVLCFAGGNIQKHSPCGVSDAFSKVMIPYHILDLQVFKGDKAVGIDYLTGDFVSEVFSLVLDSKMMPGEKFNRLTAIGAVIENKGVHSFPRGAVAMENNERLTINIPEVAKALGISRGLAYDLARRDKLPMPVIRPGKRMVLSRARFEAWLNGDGKSGDP